MNEVTLDRFPYREEMGAAFISKCGCEGRKCRESIYAGDECLALDGTYYASEACYIWATGGNKVIAGED